MKLFVTIMTFIALSPVFAVNLLGEKGKIGANTTISFENRMTILTADSKTKLNELVTEARKKGEIIQVQVAAWSDNPAPREGESLSKSDKDLADKRAKAVREYLNKIHSVSSIKTYNMAQKANLFARAFETKDAELKEEIGGRTDKNKAMREEFTAFKEHGAPGKAVIQVIMK